jgi:hypothetical protein
MDGDGPLAGAHPEVFAFALLFALKKHGATMGSRVNTYLQSNT